MKVSYSVSLRGEKGPVMSHDRYFRLLSDASQQVLVEEAFDPDKKTQLKFSRKEALQLIAGTDFIPSDDNALETFVKQKGPYIVVTAPPVVQKEQEILSHEERNNKLQLIVFNTRNLQSYELGKVSTISIETFVMENFASSGAFGLLGLVDGIKEKLSI